MLLRSFQKYMWLYVLISGALLMFYILADYRSFVTIDFL